MRKERTRGRACCFHHLGAAACCAIGLAALAAISTPFAGARESHLGQGTTLAWQPLGPTGGGIRLLAQTPAFPRVVYAVSTEDGLFRSLDGGHHWSLVSDLLAGVQCIALDPRQPRTLYVGSGSGLWKSTDGGTSFYQLSRGFELDAQYSVFALAVESSDPRRVYAAVLNGAHSIYLSVDAGQSWTPAPHETPVEEVALTLISDSTRPGTLYLGTPDGLYSSRNYGRRWVPVGGGFPARAWSGALAVDAGGTVYANDSETLFRSTDGGESWGAVPSSGLEIVELVTAAGGGLFAMSADLLHLLHSADGETWVQTALPSPAVYRSRTSALVAGSPSPGDLLLATRDGVFVSHDSGGTWAGTSQGLRASFVSALAAAPAEGAPSSTLHAIFAGALRRSRQSAAGWITENPASTFATALAIDPSDAQRIWFADTGGNVRKSADGGMSWEAPALLPLAECSTFSGIAVAPMRPETVYVVGFDDYQPACDFNPPANSYRTTDGGRNWEPMQIAGAGVVVDPREPGVLFAFGDGVARSTDGGATWSLSAGIMLRVSIVDLAIDPVNTQRLYAASSQGLLASRNRGHDFHPVHGLPAGAATGVALDARTQPPTLLVAIAGAGVFASGDAGTTWSPLGVGLPNQFLHLLLVDPTAPDTLYAGTGQGVYRLQRPPLAR